MKKTFRLFMSVLLMIMGTTTGWAEFADFGVDLRDAKGGILTADEAGVSQTVTFGIAVNDGAATRVSADAKDAIAVITGKTGNNHGLQSFSATVPVEGPVEITMSTCSWGNAVTVKDADGNDAVPTFTTKKGDGGSGCYKGNGDADENVIAVKYVGEATTLTISGGGYVGWFSVKAIDASSCSVSYSLGDVVCQGTTVPAGGSYAKGDKYTFPIQNHTLYKEGYTLTGWTDGTTTYEAGQEITLENDLALTPVFTENTVSLADRTEETTIKWNFRRDQGAPTVAFQNVTGVWVAQANVNGSIIDVKADFDTNNGGKFANGNWTDWAQLNNGTKWTVPSCKGATVSIEAFGDMGASGKTATTIDGQSDYTSGKAISYEIANSAETIDVVIGNDGSYYRYIQIVLPVVQSQGDESYDNERAKVVWSFSNTEDINENVVAPEGIFTTVAANLGDKVTIAGTGKSTTLPDVTFVKLAPTAKEDKVEWSVKPARGLTFIPTKFSANIVRFGTDVENGVVVTAKAGDRDEVTLGTFTALRESKDYTTDKFKDSKNLTNTIEIELTPEQQKLLASTDGETISVFATVGVGSGKQGGFANVTIDGIVDGTKEPVPTYVLNVVGAPENGGKVKKYPSAEVYEEGTEVTLTATPNFGYHFVNWTDAQGEVVSEEAKFTYTVNAEAALTANFTAVNTYELKYTVEGANDYMVQPTPAPEMVDGKMMYEEGTKVTLEASQYEGLVTFNNWSDGQTTSSITVEMNEDVDITAVYSQADIIAGWDFYKAGNNGRVADFAAADNEADALSLVKTGTTTTAAWLDKSTEKGGGYESFKGAAVNWQAGSTEGDVGNFHWQTKVNAEAFTDINVQFQMLYNYNAYQTYNAEYSLDGENWTQFGSITMTGAKNPSSFSKKLPAECNNQASLYIRMIADKTSNVDGSASKNDGNTLAMFFITGTQQLVDDGTAPVLQSSVPAMGSTNASANGKIVLTFDEKVKVAEGATATLNDLKLTPKVSGKTVIFEYKGLSYSTGYTFSVPANSVADLTDNYISEPITINFTTRARPTVAKADYDFIVPDDGTITEALAAANARGTSNSERFRIFIKNGNYVFDTNGTTTGGDGNTYPDPRSHLSAPNVSFIGESMEGVTITNITPDATWDNGYGQACPLEGIGNGDVLIIDKTATNTYFQNLTIKTSMGDAHGRDIAVNDQSNRTIFKDACLWGYQDTYVSNNQNGKFYFEGGVLRGRTDYMCGKGDVYYNQVTLRQVAAGYAAVPSQPKKYGYIYQSCKIVGDADGVNGNYTLGRPWGQGTPIALFIDTEMEVAPSAIGWSEMSGGYPARFAEYNSHLTSGTVVDLSGRKKLFGEHKENGITIPADKPNDPILTADEAAELTLAAVMGQDDDWDPTELTEQASAPTNVKLEGNSLSWDDSNYALLYAIVKNGSVVAFTTESIYEVDDMTAEYAVRAANEMGGLGEVAVAEKEAIEIEPIVEETVVEFHQSDFVEADEPVNLGATVINNTFYSIDNTSDPVNPAGFYSADNQCIVINKVTTDDQMATVVNNEIGTAEVAQNFTGMVVEVPAGKGKVTVSAQTMGSNNVAIKVGSATPTVASKPVMANVEIEYDVQKASYVYIYSTTAAQNFSNNIMSVGAESDDAVKIYSITITPDEITAVDNVKAAAAANGSEKAFNTAGQQVGADYKGIVIKNGQTYLQK